MLEQAQRVAQWIHKFDPQNINVKDLTMPEDLKQISNFSKKLIQSPSNRQLQFAMSKGYSGLVRNHTPNQFSRMQIRQSAMASPTTVGGGGISAVDLHDPETIISQFGSISGLDASANARNASALDFRHDNNMGSSLVETQTFLTKS